MRLYGDKVTLTSTYAPLGSGRGVFHLTVRNAEGNDTVWFSHNGVKDIGFIRAGESKTFKSMNTCSVFVRGLAGQFLYWDGEGQ